MVVAPWLYGGAYPGFVLLLNLLLLGVLGVAGALWVCAGNLTLQRCSVTICLGLLFLLGLWQTVSLPAAVLAWIAPPTLQLRERLLPEQPELLATGEPATSPASFKQTTISLYPALTREETLRVLSVFLLFLVVRHALATPASLARLSVTALVNGVFLSLFGLFQALSTDGRTLYWTQHTGYHVFGPFPNHAHYATYANLCLGLGMGLLAARWLSRGDARHSRSAPNALQDPVQLWLIVALGLVLAGIAFSLSRGGWLALGGAMLICLAWLLRRSPRSLRLGGVALILLLGLGLASWMGLGKLQDRFATLWNDADFRGNRLLLWWEALSLGCWFPVWGTGLGTYAFVEPLVRDARISPQAEVSWAHNDYLQLFAEGGLLGLILGLLAIAAVLRLGYRACRRHPSLRARAWASGALFGFLTLLIHSIGDFPIQGPAITILLTLMAAHLCALGTQANSVRKPPAPDATRTQELQWSGWAPLPAALGLVVAGMVVVATSWNRFQGDRLQMAAFQFQQLRTPEGEQRAQACLEAATQLRPWDFWLWVDLARLQQARFEAVQQRLATTQRLTELGHSFSVAGPCTSTALPGDPALLGGTTWLALKLHQQATNRSAETELAQRLFTPVLRCYLTARGCCQLPAAPHLALAGHTHLLERTDPPKKYVERAQFVAPTDPEVWHYSGVLALRLGEPATAWQCWRRELELSPARLEPILEATEHLSPQDLVEKVLPRSPALLLAAVEQLERSQPAEDFQPRTTVLLQEAARLLEPLQDPDWLLTARVQRRLEQWPAAVAAFQRYLGANARDVAVRCELAEVYLAQKQWREADLELRAVLAFQPGYPRGTELQKQLQRLEREGLP